MEKMQEEEFEKLKQKCSVEECLHLHIVKLYTLGAHSDYGCTECKLKSLVLEDFSRRYSQ